MTTTGPELLLPAESARADALAAEAGIPVDALMAAAGAAVAGDLALAVPAGSRVAVLCGPGNNGGDGFVAARILAAAGYRVRVGLAAPRDALAGAAAAAAAAWEGPIEAPETVLGETPDAIVDALFGAGLSRDLDGAAAALVAAINGTQAYRLAVDVPSGLDGATGAVRGTAVVADATVAFARRRPGHLLHPGRALCGTVRVHDIGIPDPVIAAIGPRIFANGPALWGSLRPQPGLDIHKYERGHVVTLSGGPASTGAARLAAAAALRAGAGAVTVASPPSALLVNAAQLTAVMVRSVPDPEALATLLAARTPAAAVIGPGAGVGTGTEAMVIAALSSGAALVLDADALTSFAGRADTLATAIGRRTAPVVLTPHEGEFARLFPESAGDRLARARAAAVATGAVVLLKGPDTVIAAPDGRAAINANAPPDLATAGSGDVLAGIVAALLAQHVPGFEAASMGAWLHGAAGTAAGPGLIAEDLPAALRTVMARPVWGEG